MHRVNTSIFVAILTTLLGAAAVVSAQEITRYNEGNFF